MKEKSSLSVFIHLPLVFLIAVLLYSCSGRGDSAEENYQKLKNGFIEPADTNTLWCYWYWINDDISREGITKDLMAMKQAGIGTALAANINPAGVDGKVPLFSDEWWKTMVHTVNEGKRLGVDIGFFNCPGWSQSGGPWVNPDMAMRYVTWSETVVKGPQRIDMDLPKPADEFQDISLLAFPAIKAEQVNITSLNTRLTSEPEIESLENCFDNDTSSYILLETKQTSYRIRISSGTAMEANSILLYPANVPFKCDVEVYSGISVKDTLITRFIFDRSNYNINVGPVVKGPLAVSFPSVVSSEFTVVFSNISFGVYQSSSQKVGFSEIVISNRAVLDRYIEKQLGKMDPTPFLTWNSYAWVQQAECPDEKLKILKNNIIDISDRLSDNGRVTWEVPVGEWVLMRFGMTPTGTRNANAAPRGQGYEIDKMNSNLAQFHYDNYIGELLKRIPEETRPALKYVIADSYEQGSQNWTDGYAEKFRERFGYDPVQFLPVLSGRIVGSVEESERFLWDLRRSVADDVAYEYIGGLRKAGNKNNLKLWLENYGHWGFPSEFLMYGGQSDLVAGEFWTDGDLGNIECKAASSAAHIYGKAETYAEAFTDGHNYFKKYPALLKRRGDWSFTEGINHLVLHLYIHQPDDKRKPGVNAWFGTEFNRHNTWFSLGKPYIDYLRRCQHMLQQGKYVADVCYFIGENAPVMTGVRNPELPRGYSFDYINAEVVQNRLSVNDGRLVLPDGMSYRMMVMPQLETMRPELLKRIYNLVFEGAVIMGPPPKRSPSLKDYPEADSEVQKIATELWGNVDGITVKYAETGKGMVINGLSMEEALDLLALTKDFEPGNNDSILFTHRKLGGIDIYFLTNQTGKTTSFNPQFRVIDKIPELWDAITGEARILPSFKSTNDLTEVPIKLEAYQSAFIVFDKDVKSATVSGLAANFPERSTLIEIVGPWEVTFDHTFHGPVQPVIFNKLLDWTSHESESIRFYSGTALYKTQFELDPSDLSSPLWLNIGKISGIANIRLNGKNQGGVWTSPWDIEITDAATAGNNKLEIEVANTWVNRLIGDSKLDEKQRFTWCSVNPYRPDSPLQSSGLIGPVKIINLSK